MEPSAQPESDLASRAPRRPIDLVFTSTAIKMMADLAMARELRHHGLQGTAAEGVVADFLRGYLPSRFGVTTGKVMDSRGSLSRQVDVVIFDALNCPVFYEKAEIRVVPVECVYAVLEIKSNLEGAQVADAVENMLSIRSLERTAYVDEGSPDPPTTFNMYGQEWSQWQIHYFVFAYESMALPTVASAIETHHRDRRLELNRRIDAVCVLNRGIIYNLGADRYPSVLPSEGSSLAYLETDRALLVFVTMLSEVLFRAELPAVRIGAYLKQLSSLR